MTEGRARLRRGIATGSGVAVGSAAYLLTLLAFGRDLTRTAMGLGYASNFFDLQARAFMDGRIWVPDGSLLRAELCTHPGAFVPAELHAAVDPTLEEGRVLRLHQWTMVDGVRCEPVPLEATPPVAAGIARPSTAHAQARAS